MFRWIALPALVLAIAVASAPATAADPEQEAARDAYEYFVPLQNPDGGFPAFDSESSPGSTIDAVFALVSIGFFSSNAGAPAGAFASDYLEAQAADYATDPGAAAKLALAVALMGRDPGDFASLDLLAIMDASFDAGTGAYGLDLFDQGLYMFALVAAGEPISASAVTYVQSQQLSDGGWEFAGGFESDTNTTALIMQALLAAGVDQGDPSITNGLAYFQTTQQADAGFAFLAGSDSDPSSTAFVIQALIAAGEDIDGGGSWAPGGRTPLDGLLGFQNPTTGAFQFAGADSAFATYQAVPGLMLAPFPDLVTRPDGEGPPVEGTATSSSTATILPAAPTATPALVSLSLPNVGGRSNSEGVPWVSVVAIVIGTGALGAGVVARRVR